jgi:hypothetical protein
MSQTQSSNDADFEIKEDLYMLYLELKETLTSKNISLSKDQLSEAINTTSVNIIIEYIREMINILINIKFPKKEEIIINRTKDEKDREISQMENQIRKLEYDIKFLLQKEFQNKIKRDTLEMKVNSYMEMENEFEELKEKVKYQGGEFLNNERKDNEIIILRQENGILKKEIEKHEINNKKYESKIKSEQETIQDLTNQISLLNKKVSKLELLTSQKENSIQPNTNNSSSINININNNGNSSSKWIIKQENQDHHNNNNNNNYNSNNPNLNSFTNYKIKTRKINNFTKNNAKYSISNSNNNNLNMGKRYSRYGAGYTGFQTKNHKGMNTIDNNNAFTNTYNKILNNLCVKDIKDIKDIESPNKKINKAKKIKKNNSISMYIEEYDKSVMENKYIANKGKRYNSTRKSNNNNEYNKIIGFAPNSRYPLSGKHQVNKNNNNAHSVPKKNLQKDKNSASYSSLILKRK